VVLAAIEALELTAEPGQVAAIRHSGLESHPDPEVREAYERMLDFLSD
jgi:hypothetical protein